MITPIISRIRESLQMQYSINIIDWAFELLCCIPIYTNFIGDTKSTKGEQILIAVDPLLTFCNLFQKNNKI